MSTKENLNESNELNSLSESQKVVVASTNPVKINSVKLGFEAIFPNQVFEFVGIAAASEISDQPMSQQETYQGALNRIKNARKQIPEADFWVGIEGGLHQTDEDFENIAYIVIQSKDKLTKSKTASFPLPKKVAELVKQGYEVGDADDIVFGGNNTKQKNGSVGLLTGDIITRTSYYEHAVILALIPILNKDLY